MEKMPHPSGFYFRRPVSRNSLMPVVAAIAQIDPTIDDPLRFIYTVN